MILVAGPEAEGSAKPTEAQLLATFERVAALDVPPWKDRVGEGPLLAAKLKPVEIVERKQREDLGTTEWRLRTASASSSSPPTSRTTR